MHRFGISAACAAMLALSSWTSAAASTSDGVAANVPRFVRVATLRGGVSPAMPMRLVVHLAYPRPAAVDSFVRQVHDPASPMFGHFLTPAQFTSAFGPSAASYATVIGRLQAAGFRVVGTYSNRKVVDVVGDAAHVQAFFGTAIAHVSMGRADYYTNLTPARIPPALRGTVMAVSGFNNYSRMRSHLTNAPRVGQMSPDATNPGPYGPKDIQTAYNESVHVNPAINGTSSTGAHATIAIETAFDYQDSDLAGFWTMSGVTRASGAWVYREFIDNPSGQGIFNADESEETTADVEQSTSNAPGANVLVVEGVD